MAGEGCVFKLINKFIPLRVLSPSEGMEIDLSYPEIKRMRSERLSPPRTQMGIVAAVKKYLQEAKNYADELEKSKKGTTPGEKPDRIFVAFKEKE